MAINKIIAWREANPEKQLEHTRRWRANNPDKIRLYYDKTKDRKSSNGKKYRALNKEAVAERNRKWRQANPEKMLAHSRKSHGMPKPTRPCPDTCECCGKPSIVNGKVRSLDLDHCHGSKRFRGWLCMRCNTAIGKLGDDVAGVQAALNYLLRSEQFYQSLRDAQ